MVRVMDYSLQAELALAAYSDFVANMPFEAYNDALQQGGKGMTPAQAFSFATKWRVIDQHTDALNGLSVTVFESTGTGERYLAVRGTEGLNDLSDLWTDFIDVSILGTPERQAQYRALRDQVGAWLDDRTLSAGFTVAGHSLGGFLAGALFVDYPTEISHAYLYNAPGVGGLSAGLRLLTGQETEPHLDLNKVSNLIAQAGTSLISGLGLDWSAPAAVFIEDQSPTLVGNHSIVPLTDALVVYELLNRLNPSLSLADLTPILEAGSNQPVNSLGNIVNALGDLLGAGAAVAPENRDQLYARIQAIESALPSEPPFGLTSLVHLTPDSIATAAKSDKGFLYALEQLIPFAIVGDDALYPDFDTTEYTPTYLLDRATLLEDKLIRAVSDYPQTGVGPEFVGQGSYAGQFLHLGVGPEFVGQGSYAGQFLHLVDDGTNYDARKYKNVPADAELTLRFGRDDQGDVLSGTIGKDHLYGRGGDDTLEGGGGDDYLEGGSGNDTYMFYTGGGSDTILDVDGLGRIVVRSPAGETVLGGTLDSIPGETKLYEDSDGNRYTKNGDDLLISLKDDGGQITVKHFTDGMLDINLNPVELPAVPQVPEGIPSFVLGQRAGYSYIYSPTVQAPYENPDYGYYPYPFRTESIQAQGAVGPAPGTVENIITGQAFGGLGDSYMQGDDRFNYLVDDLFYTNESTDGKPIQWLIAEPDIGPLLEGGIFVSLADQVGNDVLKGGGGNDWLESHGGDDWLYGEDGNDTLIDNPGLDFGDNRWLALPGASSDDHLFGGAGDDTVFSLQGRDYLDGGDDNDMLLSGQNDDILSGGDGSDWLLADAALNREEFIEQPDGSYDHILEAADDTEAFGKDTLFGDAGNDILAGGGDNDWLLGGTENDTLWGDGSSTFNTETGELRVAVGDGVLAGNDTLFGEAGDDALIGGGGDDYLDGGDGDDTVTGDHADLDSAYHGADHLVGGEGNDTLFGNGGDDTLAGDAGDDTLWGDEGNDHLYGGDDVDRLYGGAGDDALSGGAGDDQLVGDGGADSLFGDAGADRFDGGDGDDLLSGGSGNDELYGSAGNDMLQGGDGTDLLFGGDGDDVYRVNAGGGQDVIVDTQGTNLIAFGAGITLENLGFQEIQGTDGAHYLVMDTGAPGDRVFVRNAPQGTISRVNFADGTVVSLTGLLAHAGIPLRVLGSKHSDTIQGGAVADVFQGGGGNDRMFGADGADTLSGGDGHDSLDGDAGDDTLNGGAGNDKLRGGAGDDSYLLGWGMGQDTLVEADGENSVLQLDTDVSLADIVFVRSGSDLFVQLQGATDSLRIRDYVSSRQVLTLRTAAGVSTVVDDNLIDSAPPPVVSDAAAVHDRYLTTVRSIFNATRGDNGSILGVDGVLRRTLSQTTGYGSQTESFNERFAVVDQYSDASAISRESSPAYQSSRVQTGQNSITHADLNTQVTQQAFDTTGGSFQQPVAGGVEIGPGAALVTVHGQPEAFTGDYSDQVTGYWLFPSGLDAGQAQGLQFDTIQNTSYQTDATLTLERITAGASDNIITTTGYSIVDAGAGNDTITAYFSPDWRYNQEFQVSPWYYDRPYDRRNVGAMLDGNTGDDRLTGGEADDVLTGGDGNDFMNGGAGSDTYVITAGSTGWDLIEDSGGQAWSPETFSTRFQDWYYRLWAIDDWRERRDHGETLPELPEIAINDFVSSAQLASLGIISTDSVEFGEGISASDLTVTRGEYVPYASSEPGESINQAGPNLWMDPGSVHTTLDISWGTGSGVRVVMPHSSPLGSPISPDVLDYAPYPAVLSRDDWYLGQGIETFRFADGSELSMQAMLDLALPAPTLDPHLLDNQMEGTAAAEVLVGAGGNDTLSGGAGYDTYVFNPGDGIDTVSDAVLNGQANRIRFGAGILPGDIAVSWTADGITIHTGSAGDAIKLVNTEPNGDPSHIIDRLLFTIAGEESSSPERVSLLFSDFLPAGGGGIPGIEVTGTSRYDAPVGAPGDDVITALSGDGYTLLNTQVEQLVQAMAAFSPPASGELDLPPALQSQLEPVLVANGQVG